MPTISTALSSLTMAFTLPELWRETLCLSLS